MKAFKFKGYNGHDLAGWLHRPEGVPRAALVHAHCFTCSKDLFIGRHLAKHLAERGYALLRFDFSGVGQSEGDFAETTLATDVEDLKKALDALAETFPDLPLGLVGHSLGGTASLIAAHREPRVKALAVIAAPRDPERLGKMLGEEVEQRVAEQGLTEVTLGGRTLTITAAFLESLQIENFDRFIGEIKRPLLVLQGSEDLAVRVESSEKLFAAASQPKGFMPLVGADHLLSREEHVHQAAELLDLWFRLHLAR